MTTRPFRDRSGKRKGTDRRGPRLSRLRGRSVAGGTRPAGQLTMAAMSYPNVSMGWRIRQARLAVEQDARPAMQAVFAGQHELRAVLYPHPGRLMSAYKPASYSIRFRHPPCHTRIDQTSASPDHRDPRSDTGQRRCDGETSRSSVRAISVRTLRPTFLTGPR